jgi:hypothetical protein
LIWVKVEAFDCAILKTGVEGGIGALPAQED